MILHIILDVINFNNPISLSLLWGDLGNDVKQQKSLVVCMSVFAIILKVMCRSFLNLFVWIEPLQRKNRFYLKKDLDHILITKKCFLVLSSFYMTSMPQNVVEYLQSH